MRVTTLLIASDFALRDSFARSKEMGTFASICWTGTEFVGLVQNLLDWNRICWTGTEFVGLEQNPHSVDFLSYNKFIAVLTPR